MTGRRGFMACTGRSSCTSFNRWNDPSDGVDTSRPYSCRSACSSSDTTRASCPAS
jgi:hypothetical protein